MGGETIINHWWFRLCFPFILRTVSIEVASIISSSVPQKHKVSFWKQLFAFFIRVSHSCLAAHISGIRPFKQSYQVTELLSEP